MRKKIIMSDYSDKQHLTTLKILIIGESYVGKSSLLLRYTDDVFSNDVGATIGVDFKNKKITLDNNIINLAIWDTAGSERFRALTPSFYRGAHGAILVYDVTARPTFEKLNTWLEELNSHADKPGIVKMLVGNKIDKEGREVSRKEGMSWARAHNTLFIEASAKTKEDVECAFEELVEKIIQTPGLWEPRHSSSGDPSKVNLDQPKDGQGSGVGACCSWL